MDDDERDDQCDVCDLCGEDHETRHCEATICGKCYEMVDNCDCEPCEEIDADEWVALGCPHPKGRAR
jgi:hypothetical protein